VNILDRLLFREVFKTLAVIVFILMLVLLASHMVKLLGKAAEGALSADVLFAMVGFQSLRVLGVLVPPAFFFSLLWVLGGMHRDSEIVALQASGVGGARLYGAVIRIAIPLLLLTAVLQLFLRPWADQGIEHIKFTQKSAADISGVRAGRFNEYKKGGLVVYTRGALAGNGRLQQVFVQDRQQGELGVVMASEAYQSVDENTGDRFIVLANGTRYVGTPGQADYAVAHFDEYALRVPKLDLGGLSLGRGAQPTALLWLSDDLKARAEIQYRLSVPISVLVFALLAVPLARAPPRKDVYGRMGLAVLVYFVFLNLQRLGEHWMEVGATPAWLGMWWIAVLMLGIAGLITFLDSHWLAGHLRRLRQGSSR